MKTTKTPAEISSEQISDAIALHEQGHWVSAIVLAKAADGFLGERLERHSRPLTEEAELYCRVHNRIFHTTEKTEHSLSFKEATADLLAIPNALRHFRKDSPDNIATDWEKESRSILQRAIMCQFISGGVINEKMLSFFQ